INYSIDQETKVTIKFSEEKLMKKFDLLKYQVLSLYKKYGFASLEINSVLVDKNKDNGIKNSNEIKELDKPIPDKKSINLLEFKNDFKKNGQKNKFAKEKIKYKKVDIDLLDNDTLYFIETHGFISDIKVKTIKTYNYSYLWFIMSNYKSAIYCKIKIDSNNELSDFEEKIKNDDYVLAQGKIQYDNYKKQKIFIIDTISKLDETPYDKVDSSLKKRIEFSTRTKMSAMDGITSVECWFEFANKLGYPGIAFLDNNSVQSFPDIDKLAKKFPNIKPIYGFTCSVINEYHSAIWNVNDPSKRFSDQEYVIFDLETTGLSPIFNEIIEFGALKIKNGVVIDQLEFFVKPSSPIPIEIQKLTNITNEHISNAIDQEEALKKIIKFFGNATLVAHNANFDINFIEESIFKFNLNKLSNSVIDTLVLSKILFPNIKRFKLSNLAKRFNIDYDEEKAHRALQDAKVLFRIFQNILSALKSQNFNTYKDLIDYKKLDFIR
ncbi:MAG: PHP domain-containing protein, partial [Mycoplasma sp.]|nr:PHP domain-containing protein [Mycoplasma sp.]